MDARSTIGVFICFFVLQVSATPESESSKLLNLRPGNAFRPPYNNNWFNPLRPGYPSFNNNGYNYPKPNYPSLGFGNNYPNSNPGYLGNPGYFGNGGYPGGFGFPGGYNVYPGGSDAFPSNQGFGNGFNNGLGYNSKYKNPVEAEGGYTRRQ